MSTVSKHDVSRVMNRSTVSISPKTKSSSSVKTPRTSASHGVAHAGRKPNLAKQGKLVSRYIPEENASSDEEGECFSFVEYKQELTYLFFNSCVKHIIKRRKVIAEVVPEPKPVPEAPPDSPSLKDVDSLPLKVSKPKKHKPIERERSRSKLSFKSFNKAKENSLKLRKSTISVASAVLSKNMSKKNIRHAQQSPSVYSFVETASPAVIKPRKDRTGFDWIVKPTEKVEIIEFVNGNRYEGETSKWLMDGKGEYVWSNGTHYKGDFKDGYPDGKGTMVLQDLSTYEGDFRRSYFHGYGVFCIASTPNIYRGSWENGKKHGDGWYLYEQNNWYEGGWYEDKKQGVGFRRYRNGTKYKGMWSDNRKNGEGSMVWGNNDFYTGEWKDDTAYGYGEYSWDTVFTRSFVFPSCNWYKGNWVDGVRNGIGIMNFGTEGGAKLIGAWKNNRKHGPGIMICGNGVTLQCNPLFLDDKPVHHSAVITTFDSESYVEEETKEQYSANTKFTAQIQQQEIRNPKKEYRKILRKVNTKVGLYDFDAESLEILTQGGMQIEGQQFIMAEDFSLGRSYKFGPLEIPIHTTAEDVDLEYYINIIWEYYFRKNSTKKKSVISVPNENATANDGKARVPSGDSFKHRKANEERLVRNTITAYLPNISEIYNRYATVMASEYQMKHKHKLVLIRLFLWQLLRDIDLPRNGVSLTELDVLMDKNPKCCLDSNHCPFEPIYFWQFIQALLGCAWLLHVNKNNQGPFVSGTISSFFRQFLEVTVFPNYGKFVGSCLTIHKDLVPIKCVYSLYLQIGEPISVSDFLYFTCTDDGTNPPCYSAIDDGEEKARASLNEGNNVTIADRIIYFEEKEDISSTRVSQSEIDEENTDEFYKTLYTFRTLGRKTIIALLRRVCPPVVKRGKLRLDYKLTFLEFYETLLLCAFEKAEKKRKSEEITIKQELDAVLLKGGYVSSIMSKLGRTKKKKNKTYSSQTS